MDPQGDDELSVQLRKARLALYRPDADGAARARYDALCGRLAESMDAASPPTDEAGMPGDLRRIRGTPAITIALVVVVVVVVLLLGAGGIAVSGSLRPQQRSALSMTSPLATALDRQRWVLPAHWREARVAVASDELDGATPLHTRGRVLLAVRCPSADRSFEVVAGTRIAYGACGRPVFIALKDGSRVVVTTRGVRPFSAALLVADARP